MSNSTNCTLCNPPKTMVSEGALKMHRTRHHSDVIKEVANETRSYWCYCSKGYSHKRSLERH